MGNIDSCIQYLEGDF